MPEDLKKMDNTMNQPETRVNEVECAVKSPNIEIIEQIERKISQVNEKLHEIDAVFTTKNPKPWQAKNTALEEIDLFQRTTLWELRKALE